MSLQNYTRNVAVQPGNSPALKLEAGMAYAILVDPTRKPKAAKFDQHAVGVELYEETHSESGERKVTWRPGTLYLRAAELAELASACSDEQRTIVQAWVELTPVVNAMTGEVRTREDGSDVFRRKLRFAYEVHESAAEFGDWSAPERIESPQDARVVYSRTAATTAPPAFVRPSASIKR